MTVIKSLADVDREVHYAHLAGKADVLRELIAIWKPRDPLEQYTTNVILLELEIRLRIIEEISTRKSATSEALIKKEKKA